MFEKNGVVKSLQDWPQVLFLSLIGTFIANFFPVWLKKVIMDGVRIRPDKWDVDDVGRTWSRYHKQILE